MPSLSPLEQLAVDAFATALETCREEGVELPDEVWAIAQSPEHHIASLSEIAKQHPQLNAAYRTARKLLRQVEAERHKRMGNLNHVQVREPSQSFPELPISDSEFPWEQAVIPFSTSGNSSKTSDSSTSRDPSPVLSPPPVQPIIYRYTLPDTASPQAAISFAKQVEAIRQSNPDWVVSFDRPNPGEADAIVLIHKDEHYAATHVAYLANRTLNQVVGPALNRIFSRTFTSTPQTFQTSR